MYTGKAEAAAAPPPAARWQEDGRGPSGQPGEASPPSSSHQRLPFLPHSSHVLHCARIPLILPRAPRRRRSLLPRWREHPALALARRSAQPPPRARQSARSDLAACWFGWEEERLDWLVGGGEAGLVGRRPISSRLPIPAPLHLHPLYLNLHHCTTPSCTYLLLLTAQPSHHVLYLLKAADDEYYGGSGSESDVELDKPASKKRVQVGRLPTLAAMLHSCCCCSVLCVRAVCCVCCVLCCVLCAALASLPLPLLALPLPLLPHSATVNFTLVVNCPLRA